MPLSPDELEKYEKAGQVCAKVRDQLRSFVKPGVSLLQIADEAESATQDFGGHAAFPVNLSLNNQAAHYTPSKNDPTILKEDDLIKVDVGVHVDGFIADCAFSYSASEKHAKLIEASEQALKAAIEAMKPGVNVKEIGRLVKEKINSYGYNPVENLCGHSLAPFILHAGQEIPNAPSGNYELKEGDVFAVEPFATDGQGRVREGDYCQIYSVILLGKKVRMPSSRKILDFATNEFQTLPFARRWLSGLGLSETETDFGLAGLVKNGILHAYPVLAEKPGLFVSQAETTVVVEKDGARPML